MVEACQSTWSALISDVIRLVFYLVWGSLSKTTPPTRSHRGSDQPSMRREESILVIKKAYFWTYFFWFVTFSFSKSFRFWDWCYFSVKLDVTLKLSQFDGSFFLEKFAEYSVEKWEIYSHRIFFRQINYQVIYLVKHSYFHEIFPKKWQRNVFPITFRETNFLQFCSTNLVSRNFLESVSVTFHNNQ